MDKRKPLITIVDDDVSVCRAIQRLVRSLNMNAETFNSGAEFTKLIETVPSFRADCAILDVQMPGMTGLEVQAWLAQAGNALPIIFITAHDEVGVRERALALGAVAFLLKPFDDELFAKTLRAALHTGTEET